MTGPLRKLTFAAAVVGAALAVAACGSDSTTTSTVTETVGGSGATAGTTDGTAPTTGDGSAGADKTVTELTGFTSPTGNIGCYIDQRSVRCDIGDRDWSPPKAPKSCQLDYGQGIELRAGGAADFVCAGDTALGGGETLAYGSSIGAGLLVCESAESGMTCRDTETGRGFTISKQSYEIF